MKPCAHGDVIRENNKIRKENERLRKENERLNCDLDGARRSLAASYTMKEHFRIHYEDLRNRGDR